MAINIAVVDVIKVINIPLTMLLSHQSLRLFQRSDGSFFGLLLQRKGILVESSVSSLCRNFVVGVWYADEGKQITDADCKTVTESNELSLLFGELFFCCTILGLSESKIKKEQHTNFSCTLSEILPSQIYPGL